MTLRLILELYNYSMLKLILGSCDYDITIIKKVIIYLLK